MVPPYIAAPEIEFAHAVPRRSNTAAGIELSTERTGGSPARERRALSRQKAFNARFAVWFDEEFDRAMADRELLTQICTEVSREEQSS